MRAFLVVWGGQLVSILGTSLTGFGLQVWVFLETGSVTRLAIATLCFALPQVLLAPVAGALVDRWDRRATMLAADLGAGLATLGVAVLHFGGALEVWHVYALVGFGAIANTFQGPAWMASVPLLVPKRHLGRANGMVQMSDAVGVIAAPVVAGFLLAAVGLGAVLLADLGTFLVAVATLAAVRFPRPGRVESERGASLLDDVRIGWRYLRERPGLLWLLAVFAGVNLTMSFTNVLAIPLVISFSDESVVGTVFSIAGFGMLAGSASVSIWGGPGHGRRVRGILVGLLAGGAFVVLIGSRPSIPTIATGFFLLMLCSTVVNATSQALWQLKVSPGVQGRVFALRRTISSGVMPLGIAVAGPLADRVFEPLMARSGVLAGSVGRVIGTGPGRGAGLMIVLSGLGVMAMAVVGWLNPRVRELEEQLPDVIEDGPPAGGLPTPGEAVLVANDAGPAAQ
jgi:MFS family permease